MIWLSNMSGIGNLVIGRCGKIESNEKKKESGDFFDYIIDCK